MEMEEWGYVVDFLPAGRAGERLAEPMAQLIGERYFTLLEVTPKPGINLSLGQKVYIGKENRAEIDRIRRRIEFFEMTAAAKNELEEVLKIAVEKREADFVGFFNKCGPVSIRLHQIELLPGIGKKHMQEILEQRDIKPFESFADVRNRVTLMPDPVHLIVSRIKEELGGTSKYYMFVRPPSLHKDDGYRG
jgi:putative nucleotide binding protein